MDKLYKDLIESGWTIDDVEKADYFHLLHLFGEVDSKQSDRMDAEDFFRTILSPKDVQKLDGGE